LAIAGFPWASGFIPKDEILWKAFTQENLAFLGWPAPWSRQLIYFIGIIRGDRNLVLHVPQLLHDFHRGVPRRRRPR